MVSLRVFVPLFALFLLSSSALCESCSACANSQSSSFYCPVTEECVIAAKQPTTPCTYAPRNNATQWIALGGDSSLCPEVYCPLSNGNCSACLSSPTCGLCRGFYCLAGSPHGAAPSYNATCPGTWSWGSATTTCATVAPCLEASSDCAACTSMPSCGYWVAQQTCLPGTEHGSLDPTKPFDAHAMGANASNPLSGWKFSAKEKCTACSVSIPLGTGSTRVPGFCEACLAMDKCAWSYEGVCQEYVMVKPEKDGESEVKRILAEKGAEATDLTFAESRKECVKQDHAVKVSALIAGVAAAVGVGVAFLVVVIFVALNVLIWKQGKTAEEYSTLNH